ncbi:MAG: hypothetical protein ACI9XO_000996 [Paraglaciecola sp.]|jgi:hypothetical protein
MYKTNCLKLLKKLSIAELRRFREYVESPFFNKNERVKMLCALIYETLPNFGNGSLDKKMLFSKLFNNQPYSRLPINNIVSDLQKLLLDFLAYEEISVAPDWNIIPQMRALQKQEIPQLIEQRARRYRQIQEKSKTRNADFFQQESQFYDQLDKLFLNKQKRGYDENLQLRNDALDHFYQISKLQIACDMQSRNTVMGTNYRWEIPQVADTSEVSVTYHTDEIPDKNKGADTPKVSAIWTIQIYTKTLQMLENRNEEQHYFDLKKLLNEHFDLFPKSELAGIYSFALNYCVQKINFGKKEYDREILELYQTLLQRELIFKNGFLTQWTFRNIVTIGIRTGAFDWTEAFILNYQKRLLPEERENAVSYNLASLYFSKKEHQVALLELQKVYFTDNFYQIGAKTIQLKSYFELEETEAFLSLVTAFNRYLRRHRQLSKYHQELNLNFIKMAKKVYLWQNSEGRIGRKMFLKKGEDLAAELVGIERIANKNWLESKF